MDCAKQTLRCVSQERCCEIVNNFAPRRDADDMTILGARIGFLNLFSKKYHSTVAVYGEVVPGIVCATTTDHPRIDNAVPKGRDRARGKYKSSEDVYQRLGVLTNEDEQGLLLVSEGLCANAFHEDTPRSARCVIGLRSRLTRWLQTSMESRRVSTTDAAGASSHRTVLYHRVLI